MSKPPANVESETVVIGYLSDGNTKLEFTAALSSATAYMISHALVDPTFPRLVDQLPKMSGPRIAAGRNSLVEHFLTTGADWLAMLDTDMSFEHDAIVRLLAAAHPEHRPVVGGFAIAGGRDGWFPTLSIVTAEGVIGRLTDFPEDQLVPVDATGAACLVIHRSVLVKMAEEYPKPWQWFQESTYGPKSVGEDFTFCLRARSLGFPTFVHTGVKFGHCKEVTVTDAWWRKWLESHRAVIVGSGRCGTGYMAATFSALGVECGHEQVYGPRSTGWGNRRMEASWMALPTVERIRRLAGDVPQPFVAHLVRNPLHVVRSLVGIGMFDDEPDPAHWPYLDYIPDEFRFAEHGSPVARACRFVVDWNERCEAVADVRLNVETVTGDDLHPLIEAVGAWHSPYEVDAMLATVPKNINARPRSDELTWDDMSAEVRDLAVRYGYSIEE